MTEEKDNVSPYNTIISFCLISDVKHLTANELLIEIKLLVVYEKLRKSTFKDAYSSSLKANYPLLLYVKSFIDKMSYLFQFFW